MAAAAFISLSRGMIVAARAQPRTNIFSHHDYDDDGKWLLYTSWVMSKDQL